MIITQDDLPGIRREFPGKKIVFCTGAFDLTHAGHARFLAEAKKLGDVLCVGVGQDKDIKFVKGPERPVIKEQLRLKMIDALRSVDYTFLHCSPKPQTDYLSPIREICDALKPDIWVVNYDAAQLENRKALAEQKGVELKILNLNRDAPEFEGLSTTQMIEKIKRIAASEDKGL